MLHRQVAATATGNTREGALLSKLAALAPRRPLPVLLPTTTRSAQFALPRTRQGTARHGTARQQGSEACPCCTADTVGRQRRAGSP